MADEEILDHQQELSDLKEEYAKLQEHLTNVEIRYQTELTESNQQRHNDFAVRLQDVVVNLFGRSQFSDLKVLLENGSDLSVHKLVLLARSEDWGVPDLDEVDILDLRGIKYEVAYGMMKWVYTDEMDVEEEDDYLVELLKTATKYKLEALHIRCQNMMISIVNLDNANKFYIAATESSAELLKDHCMEFLSKHQFTKSGDDFFSGGDDERKDGDIKFKTSFSSSYQKDISIDEDTKMITSNIGIFPKITLKIKKKQTARKSMSVACSSSTDDIFVSDKLKKPYYFCDACEVSTSLADVVTYKTSDGKEVNLCSPCKYDKCQDGTLMIIKPKHNSSTCGKLNTYKYKIKAPFTCNICGKHLSRYDTLRRHEKIHLELKPHVCHVCGKSFVRLSHLRRHTGTHSEEKL